MDVVFRATDCARRAPQFPAFRRNRGKQGLLDLRRDQTLSASRSPHCMHEQFVLSRHPAPPFSKPPKEACVERPRLQPGSPTLGSSKLSDDALFDALLAAPLTSETHDGRGALRGAAPPAQAERPKAAERPKKGIDFLAAAPRRFGEISGRPAAALFEQ